MEEVGAPVWRGSITPITPASCPSVHRRGLGTEPAKEAAEGVAWLCGVAERLGDEPMLSKLSVNDKSKDSLRSLDIEAVLDPRVCCVSMLLVSMCGYIRASMALMHKALHRRDRRDRIDGARASTCMYQG